MRLAGIRAVWMLPTFTMMRKVVQNPASLNPTDLKHWRIMLWGQQCNGKNLCRYFQGGLEARMNRVWRVEANGILRATSVVLNS